MIFSLRKKKKSKHNVKKMNETLAKLEDSRLADELSKLVDKNDKAGEIIEEIAKKKLVKSEPTKAEIAFKNMQEKKVSLFDKFNCF